MRITLEADSAAAVLASDEAIAELVREDLFAAVTLPRAVLHRRVATRGGLPLERIRPVVERLTAIGDITEGTGGILASAPVRVVDRGVGRGFWLGTTPRRWLARRAPDVRVEDGWPRGVQVDLAMRSAVERLGGAMLSMRAWVGLDDVLPAGAWLEEMQARLERAHRVNGALLPGETKPAHFLLELGWRAGLPASSALTLIRWTESGFLRWGVVSDARLVTLSADEARRGTLALKLHAARPATYRVARGDTALALQTDTWLPAAEWRLMVGLATAVHRDRRVVRAELPVEVGRELIAALQQAGFREST